jgi:hypothetical protein
MLYEHNVRRNLIKTLMLFIATISIAIILLFPMGCGEGDSSSSKQTKGDVSITSASTIGQERYGIPIIKVTVENTTDEDVIIGSSNFGLLYSAEIGATSRARGTWIEGMHPGTAMSKGPSFTDIEPILTIPSGIKTTFYVSFDSLWRDPSSGRFLSLEFHEKSALEDEGPYAIDYVDIEKGIRMSHGL